MNYLGRSAFEHGAAPGAAVVLVNLGTPDAPDTRSLRRFLHEFLSDPRVVELPRFVWWPLLHGLILRTRPQRSARAYQKVWTASGSPLAQHSVALAQAVEQKLATTTASHVSVRVAMRYGKPGLAGVLRELHDANLQRLLVVPLYPQYSGSTTGSTFDALADELKTWRWVPELGFLSDYYAHPGYSEAIADSIRRHWAERGPRHLLLSFHGLPERYRQAGDPYFCQCLASTRLIAERLGLGDGDWTIAFQSRMGREPWLGPSLDEAIRALRTKGVDALDVVCPGFAVDCLETLEEVAIEGRRHFRELGGKAFDYLPALNASDEHASLLCRLIHERCAHWPEFSPAAAHEAERTRPLTALRRQNWLEQHQE